MSAGPAMRCWAMSQPMLTMAATTRCAIKPGLSWIDRLVDIAEALATAGQRGFLFVVAGDVGLSASMPGVLGDVARRGGTLRDYAEARGVGDMFLFLGHVPDPERVLAACDVLAKPTREDNPWGRDILEALAMGKPVLSVGVDATFVETGVTGILQRRFDAEALAEDLIALAADDNRCRTMGEGARNRIRRLCNGADRAADLAAVWRRVADEKNGFLERR